MCTQTISDVKGCTDKIELLNTILAWIPGGYTWKLQPLDVGLNRPFKYHMKNECGDFMYGQMDMPAEEQKKVSRASRRSWMGF